MDCPESLLQWESQVSWWVKDHWRPAARKLQPLDNNDCIGRVPSPNQIPFNSTLLFGRPKLHVGLYGCAPLNNPPKQQGAGRVLIRNSTRAYSRTCPNKAKPCQAATNLLCHEGIAWLQQAFAPHIEENRHLDVRPTGCLPAHLWVEIILSILKS